MVPVGVFYLHYRSGARASFIMFNKGLKYMGIGMALAQPEINIPHCL